jgi:hypothetical protein
MSQTLSLHEVSTRGVEWFARLESTLTHDFSLRDYVAIDVVSGEYAVARSTSQAMRTLHRLHPNAQLFLRRIGDEPEPELAARLFDAETGRDK